MNPYEDPLLDLEGVVGRITATIEGEGLSVESFVNAVGAHYPSPLAEQPPLTSSVIRQAFEIIRFIEASTLGVWGFIFTFLDHRFHRRRLQRHDLRGHNPESRALIRNILMTIRDGIYDAGNGESVWRAFIQEQADILNINSDELATIPDELATNTEHSA